MKNRFAIVLLAIALTACASAHPNGTDIQSTAIVLAKTGVALTQTAQPTATLPPTLTPTVMVTYPTPSPYPTQKPLPIFTPDAIQVERWKEYQTELAKAVLFHSGHTFQQQAMCEWDILGQSAQEVYVWTYCAGPGGQGGNSTSAVIYLKTDGTIQKVRVPVYVSAETTNENELFPAEIREKFKLYSGDSRFSGRVSELINHLKYRETHLNEPPLVILSANPMVTPLP